MGRGWNKGLWVERGTMGGTRDLHKGVPALGGEGDGIAVTRDETEVDGLLSFFGSGTATVLYIDRGVLGGSDVANDVDVVKGNEFLVVVDVAGEEELIVFAAVECAGDDIEVHLFGKRRSLVVDRQFVLVDIAPYPGLRADVEELGRQPVGNVHHGGGFDAGFAECFDDVDARFGFQLTFEEVLTSFELLVDSIVVLLGFAEVAMLRGAEDLKFAFEELEPEIRRAEVAGDADEIADLGALAIDDIVVVSYAETGDGDRKTVHRGAGVAADEVDIIMFARDAHTRVELFDILDREPRRYTQAYGDLRWRSVHGADVGDIDRHGFVAEVTERDVLQVEMNTFEQQIGGNERAFALMVEHSGVIAYGIDG